MNSPNTPLPEPIVDEAINWLVRLEMSEAQRDEHTAFAQWLQQSDQHQLAWERVKTIRGRFVSLPSKPLTQTIQTLESNDTQSKISRRNMLKLLSLSGLALGSGWLTKEHTPWQRLLADYTTDIGQQQKFILPDGSEVMLNTDSALSADFSAESPKLNLRRGEMYLRPADNERRYSSPLLIKTPAGRINTLDGQLIVRLDRSRAHISVQAGRVSLLNRQGAKLKVSSGERVLLSDAGIVTEQPIISPDAWISGAISGQRIPLGTLLDELSRYRHGIIDYSPELKDFPVSGIFHLKDIDKTLNFIAEVQPLRIEYRTPLWVVVLPA